MPIETRWYDTEKHIIHNQVYDRWTLHDTVNAFKAAEHLIGDGKIPDFFVWDYTHAHSVPSGLLGLASFFAQEMSSEPHYVIILVDVPRFIYILVGLMRILPEGRILFVDSLAEMEHEVAQAKVRSN